jgi:hypothetical protein
MMTTAISTVTTATGSRFDRVVSAASASVRNTLADAFSYLRAALLTLHTTPAIYLYLGRLRHLAGRARAANEILTLLPESSPMPFGGQSATGRAPCRRH